MDRGSLQPGHRRGLRGRPGVLPGPVRPAPADGRLPAEDAAGIRVHAASGAGDFLRRAALEPVRTVDRRPVQSGDRRRLRWRTVLPQEPQHARPDGGLPDEDLRSPALRSIGSAGRRGRNRRSIGGESRALMPAFRARGNLLASALAASLSLCSLAHADPLSGGPRVSPSPASHTPDVDCGPESFTQNASTAPEAQVSQTCIIQDDTFRHFDTSWWRAFRLGDYGIAGN